MGEQLAACSATPTSIRKIKRGARRQSSRAPWSTKRVATIGRLVRARDAERARRHEQHIPSVPA
eukprot:965694-Pyramimonas_sp.AAC.1